MFDVGLTYVSRTCNACPVRPTKSTGRMCCTFTRACVHKHTQKHTNTHTFMHSRHLACSLFPFLFLSLFLSRLCTHKRPCAMRANDHATMRVHEDALRARAYVRMCSCIAHAPCVCLPKPCVRVCMCACERGCTHSHTYTYKHYKCMQN